MVGRCGAILEAHGYVPARSRASPVPTRSSYAGAYNASGSGCIVSVTKRIVCLANSRKLNGRCIAGKELTASGAGAWIRPVSARESEEISEEERRYRDGGDPRLLDIIDVPLVAAQPNGCQQENWVIDAQAYWMKVGRASLENLGVFLDQDDVLWPNGYSTNNGLNDRIPLDLASSSTDSLRLVHLDNLTLRVFAPGDAFGNPKRRVQASFQLHGVNYTLWVTDPMIERRYLAGPDGEQVLRDAFLTVSIGEPYQDYCYKLVAAVISTDLSS